MSWLGGFPRLPSSMPLALLRSLLISFLITCSSPYIIMSYFDHLTTKLPSLPRGTVPWDYQILFLTSHPSSFVYFQSLSYNTSIFSHLSFVGVVHLSELFTLLLSSFLFKMFLVMSRKLFLVSSFVTSHIRKPHLHTPESPTNVFIASQRLWFLRIL